MEIKLLSNMLTSSFSLDHCEISGTDRKIQAFAAFLFIESILLTNIVSSVKSYFKAQSFLSIIRGLGFEGNKEGMCFGYVMMAAQASFCSKREDFNNRRKNIEGLRERHAPHVHTHLMKSQEGALKVLSSKTASFSEKATAQADLDEYVDLMAFFQGMDGFQNPEKIGEVYPEVFLTTTRQSKKQLAFEGNQWSFGYPEIREVGIPKFQKDKLIGATAPLFQSKELESRGGMDLVMRLEKPYSRENTLFFIEVFKKFFQEEAFPGFVLVLFANGHASAVDYDKEKKAWLFIDINEEKTLEISSDAYLQDAIEEGFSNLKKSDSMKVYAFSLKKDVLSIRKRLLENPEVRELFNGK